MLSRVCGALPGNGQWSFRKPREGLRPPKHHDQGGLRRMGQAVGSTQRTAGPFELEQSVTIFDRGTLHILRIRHSPLEEGRGEVERACCHALPDLESCLGALPVSATNVLVLGFLLIPPILPLPSCLPVASRVRLLLLVTGVCIALHQILH
ncbi:hypothetical protein NDU88_004560 [Pleurodeles waltl]|uniref:Uncharacterized protein n=1 Tax=Pleurodeles waltl TaxID=8319 RepID=A0AAV7M8J9_PLEWA|nr:hypothetical protein NDU88_004560 [Pleurodeles waltl]